jgi:hypothetical protein
MVCPLDLAEEKRYPSLPVVGFAVPAPVVRELRVEVALQPLLHPPQDWHPLWGLVETAAGPRLRWGSARQPVSPLAARLVGFAEVHFRFLAPFYSPQVLNE